jgi:hypothetical protein
MTLLTAIAVANCGEPPKEPPKVPPKEPPKDGLQALNCLQVLALQRHRTVKLVPYNFST